TILAGGYEEDVSIINTKILLGLAAIAFALYAQFGPGKFPANWWSVAFCVLCYSALSMIINMYSQRKEGDAFLVCKPRKPGDQGLRLASRMAKYDDKYTLVISSSAMKKSGDYREVTFTDSVAAFFHADSFFSEAAFKPRVEALLVQFESEAAKKSK
ncbi:signal peptidase complex subunit 2, partial [Dunaliella salina]